MEMSLEHISCITRYSLNSIKTNKVALIKPQVQISSSSKFQDMKDETFSKSLPSNKTPNKRKTKPPFTLN